MSEVYDKPPEVCGVCGAKILWEEYRTVAYHCGLALIQAWTTINDNGEICAPWVVREQCGNASKVVACQRDTIAALASQRDRLLEVLSLMVKEARFYDDEGDHVNCSYCGRYAWGVETIKHDDDCPYILAQAAIAEVEAQMKS